MYSNFRQFAIIALFILGCLNSIFGQNSDPDSKQRKIYVQLKPGITFPVAFGNNFLSEAYDLKPGFLGEARVFLPDGFFVGIQGSFFKADVTDAARVGDFDSSNIWHNYLTGGYSFLPRDSKLGLDAGAGFGYAIYANRKQDVAFHEDGFTLMANLNATYRFSEVVGVGAGIQWTRDFLATETAPELESFFKNANLLYLSVGLVFYINQ